MDFTVCGSHAARGIPRLFGAIFHRVGKAPVPVDLFTLKNVPDYFLSTFIPDLKRTTKLKLNWKVTSINFPVGDVTLKPIQLVT